MRHSRGFTLVELITVIVLLSIVAAVGTGFVVSSVESYRDSEQRAKLLQKGRLAIEQMTRQLRIALPNALRVSSSGNCIEFMPIVGGANYLNPVPSVQNGAPAATSISTATFDIGLGTGLNAVVGALSADEVYTAASPASRVDTAAPMTGGPYASVGLATAHRFLRNSISQRIYVTDDPVRFCVSGNQLMQYSGYGIIASAPIGDTSPGGTATIVSSGISPGAGGAFRLSAGSQDRNAAVRMELIVSQGQASITLDHQVLVRNVP